MSTVRLANAGDLIRVCRTAVHAFVDDPVMRWFWPTDEEYLAGEGATMHSFMRRWLAHGATYTTDDCVAVAAFVPPGRPEVEVEPAPDALPASDELLAKFVAVGTSMAEHTPAEPHWYLNLLATHPHWQGQGLGALVMGPIVDVCDREILPMYLETETVKNIAYYSHLGFVVRSEWDVPLDGPHMWGMIRPPQERV